MRFQAYSRCLWEPRSVLTVKRIFPYHARVDLVSKDIVGRNTTNCSNLKRSGMLLQAKLPSSCHQRVFIPRGRGCSGRLLTHSVWWGRTKKVPGVMWTICTTFSVSKPTATFPCLCYWQEHCDSPKLHWGTGTQDYTGYFNISDQSHKYTSTHLTSRYQTK